MESFQGENGIFVQTTELLWWFRTLLLNYILIKGTSIRVGESNRKELSEKGGGGDGGRGGGEPRNPTIWV